MKSKTRQQTNSTKPAFFNFTIHRQTSTGGLRSTSIEKLKNKIYKKIVNNIRQVKSFQKLEPNWNFNNALPISEAVVLRVTKIITQLGVLQPEVFPTGRNSIQLEYDKENGDYLEFEIFENSILGLSIISDTEHEFNIENESHIINYVKMFYA